MLAEPLPLAGLLALLVALAFWMESSLSWARHVGASLLVILFGAIVSNVGLVPVRSPVYDLLTGPVTSLAIVWLLFGVDLRDLRQAGPRMIAAFGIGVLATALGALTASLLFAPAFGEDSWRLAGVMTGTYSGGSLNFVGVARAVDLRPSLLTAATAADNLVTALWMGACLVAPLLIGRFYPQRVRARETTDTRKLTHTELRLVDLASLLALGLLVVAAMDALASHLPGPSIVWLTATALIVGQVPAVRALRGSLLLGVFCLNLFFVAIGTASRMDEILQVGLSILWLTLLVVVVHGIVIFAVGRLLRFDVETLAVASQAAVGGPSTAIALTTSRRWPDLTLPGAAVGLLGYAVGNYAGLLMALVVRGLLTG